MITSYEGCSGLKNEPTTYFVPFFIRGAERTLLEIKKNLHHINRNFWIWTHIKCVLILCVYTCALRMQLQSSTASEMNSFLESNYVCIQPEINYLFGIVWILITFHEQHTIQRKECVTHYYFHSDFNFKQFDSYDVFAMLMNFTNPFSIRDIFAEMKFWNGEIISQRV